MPRPSDPPSRRPSVVPKPRPWQILPGAMAARWGLRHGITVAPIRRHPIATKDAPMEALVHRLAAAAPHDVSALEAAIDAGTIRPEAIVAVLGKTEGNGCVNDFTRGYATV